MIKTIFNLAIFATLAVLLMPGNERHRDQAVRSVVAAYAHAATYCDRYQESCDQLSASLNQARLNFAHEAVTFSNATYAPYPAPLRQDD